MRDTIRKNLLLLQNEIAPYTPNIIAVTKYFPSEAIIEAYEAGIKDFAESRAVEAAEKIDSLPQEIKDNSRFHFIGHLQSNKVSKVVGNYYLIHSVDSLKIAKAISEEAIKKQKIQRVLLQINNANEIQKSGFSLEELFEQIPQIFELEGIKIVGIMNIAPLAASEPELRKLFQEIQKTLDAINKEFNCDLKEISMGMSNDYAIAVEYGSTMLRIGRKLFSQ